MSIMILSPANTFKRFIAFLVDQFVFSFFLFPSVLGNLGLILSEKRMVISIDMWILGVLMIFISKVCFYYFVGATPGKMLMGLRLVSRYQVYAMNPTTAEMDSGSAHELTLVQVFLRVLADSLSIFVGDSLKALMFFRLDRTHVSDWIAETRVVQLTPRNHPPRRRWIIGSILFVILLKNGILKSYYLFKESEVQQGKIYIRL